MPRDPGSEETLFAAALQWETPDQRAAFLEEACAGNPELRRRVEELLRASEQAGDFFDNPPERPGQPAAAADPAEVGVKPAFPHAGPAETPGMRIGRYQLLQQIGEGGCGTVFLAEQDEPVRRRVALKVIKLGMDTKAVIARFEVEQQALAMMDHPNIAKVLDAGVTANGRPYFVMELVQGIPITRYCDENQLDTRQRLGLFVQTCHAIQHAHQKGIIHRDLKPSNILVTILEGQPVPKVIDFGVAKAIEGRLTDHTLFTTFEQFIGTPAYMSPEQAGLSALDIDTRSDLYSLGVLLYELLTGRTPFDAKEVLSRGLNEVRRTIHEVEPPTPSSRLSTLQGDALRDTAKQHGTVAVKLVNLVRGDLDWIVMKCLEKDRSRRYATANGLAADVMRHLNDEPVLAGPPRWSYRLGKGIRRHRWAVATATVIALILLGGIGVSTWQAARATRAEVEQRRLTVRTETARQQAVKQRRRAETGEAASRDLLYFATLNRVRQAWDEGSIETAIQMIGDVESYAQRGFEWYYWQLEMHRDVRTYYGHSGPVIGAEFLPDGRRIISCSRDGTVKVWDAANGQTLQTLVEPSGWISAMAVSSRGRQIATAGREGMVTIWDLETGASVLRFKVDSDEVDCLAFSPEDERLLTGSLGQPIQLWDAHTGRELGRFGEHMRRGSSAAFVPGGRRLVSTELAAISLWDAATLKKLNRFQIPEAGAALACSPNGRCALVAESGSQAALWDLDAGRSVVTLDGQSGSLTCVAFSADGHVMMTGAHNGVARLWTVNGQLLLTLKGHRASVTSVAFSPNSRWVVTGSEDGMVKVWSAVVPPGFRLRFTGSRPAESLQCLEMSPDQKHFVSGEANGSARIWDFTTGKESLKLAGHTDAVAAVSVSADGGQIATGSWDQTAKLWDAATGRERLTLEGHQGHVDAVAFSPDGHFVVTADENGEARLWDTALGQERFKLRGDGAGFSAVEFSPDGRWIAAGDRDGVITLWDAASGGRVRSLRGRDWVRALAFSPDSLKIVGGQNDGKTIGWEVETGNQLFTMAGHSAEVRSVGFSPDGQRILTASRDKTSRVWDSATGRELLILGDRPSSGELAVFSRNGRRIIANNLGEIHVWESASTPEVRTWSGQESEFQAGQLLPPGESDSVNEGRLRSPAVQASQQKARIRALELRANLTARMQGWEAAAEDLRGIIKLDPEQHSAWFRLAPLLLQRPNTAAFRRHRAEMLARFGDTRDPVVAERTVRACLLLPPSTPEEMAILDRLSEVAGVAARNGVGDLASRNCELARGLALYRQGQFAECERQLLKAMEALEIGPDDDATLSLSAEGKAVLAMAQYRLGRLEEAPATLVQGESLSVSKPEYDYGEGWHERLIIRILIREARELINGGTPHSRSRRGEEADPPAQADSP